MTEDISDTIYHMKVRFFNLVLIQDDNLNNILDLLYQKQSNSTAIMVISSKITKDFELKCLQKGALCVIQEPFCKELLLAKIEAIHRENFQKKSFYKDYFIVDREDKEILNLNGEDLKIKGKAFDVLDYLIKNKYRSSISKDELINALWEDPELISPNVIDLNVNTIRAKLKQHLHIDIIDRVRSKGYRLK